MFDGVLEDLSHPFVVISFDVAVLRLSAALILGAVIGWEREAAHKGAGLRTHILISIAACLFMLLAFELVGIFERYEGIEADPLGLIGAVTSGVAFLAAGSIILSGGKLQGVTTGAGMWLAGAIGLACGIGRLPLAVIATILAWIVLWAIARIQPASKESDKVKSDSEQTDQKAEKPGKQKISE